MRFADISELPEAIRLSMPPAAQRLYLSRYNDSWSEDHDDAVAHVLAMQGVKQLYREQGGKYVRRLSEDARASVLLMSVVDLEAVRIAAGTSSGRELWIDCLREGSWEHPEHGTIAVTLADMQTIVSNFNRRVIGRDPHLDYGHLSYYPQGVDDLDAAGWFRKLDLREVDTPVSVKKDGSLSYAKKWHLFGLVDFASDAWSKVLERKLRYVSPTFNMHYEQKETGRDVGPTLEAAALTNTPFLTGLVPIMATEPVMGREVRNTRAKPAGGVRMDELLKLLKAKSYKFSDLVSKLTAAGIQNARETATTLMLSLAGVDVSKAVSLDELKKHVPEMAEDLTRASKTEFIGVVFASEVIESLKLVFTETTTPPAGSTETPPAGNADVRQLSERLSLIETELRDTREAMRRDQSGRVELLLSELGKKNDKGLAFAPAFVQKVRTMLGIKPSKDGLAVSLSEPIKLSESQTAGSHAEAFLLLLADVRDGKALVNLTQVSRDRTTKPTGGQGIAAHLSYTPDSIPADVMERNRATFGRNVSSRSVFLSELAVSIRAKTEADKKSISLAEAQQKADAMMLSELGAGSSDNSEDEED